MREGIGRHDSFSPGGRLCRVQSQLANREGCREATGGLGIVTGRSNSFCSVEVVAIRKIWIEIQEATQLTIYVGIRP